MTFSGVDEDVFRSPARVDASAFRREPARLRLC